MPDTEPRLISSVDAGASVDTSPAGGAEVPDWLTNLNKEDLEPEAEAPIVTGGDGGNGGEPPEAPPLAPALSIEEQYARLGEPITRARAAREADRAALPERQLKFLDSRGEVQRAAKEAAEKAAPFQLEDGQRSRLEGLQGKLGALRDRVTPLPESLVAEKAGRRGALPEADVAARQETAAKWNEEIACQQAVIESLDIGGKVRAIQEAQDAYNELVTAHREVGSQAKRAVKELVKAEKALATDQERMKTLVEAGGLTEMEANLILEQKPAYQQKAAAELEKARLEQETAVAKLRTAEAKAKVEALRAEEEVARTAVEEVEGLIGQRRAGIDAAVAEMAVSDEVTERTRQQLTRAGERIARSQMETGQKIEANRLAGDIQETQVFVDRIAEIRILPGGLESQLKLLDQRIDYVRQPGAVMDFDPALAGAIEDAVDAFGGGDSGRERYMKKLAADRVNLQFLRDVVDNPDSLADTSYYVPEALRQGIRDAKEGGGFMEIESDYPEVRGLNEIRRETVAKFLESLGLEVPLTAEAQEKQRQEIERFGELRAMLESDQEPEGDEQLKKRWRLWKARQAGQEEIKNARAGVVEAQQKVDELTAQLEEERKQGGEKAADLEEQLTATKTAAVQREADLLKQAEMERQRAEELAPVAGEAQAQITSALEAAVGDLGSASTPDNLKAPLAAGETLAFRLRAIETWRDEELKKNLHDTKEKLGVNPDTGKAGDGKEHENSVNKVTEVLTKFAQGRVDEKTVRGAINELRRIPGVGAALAESLTKMVDRLIVNRTSLSDDDVTEVIGKNGKMRKLLGAPELAGIGAGAVAGMLPLFEGMFNTALASMGLAGR